MWQEFNGATEDGTRDYAGGVPIVQDGCDPILCLRRRHERVTPTGARTVVSMKEQWSQWGVGGTRRYGDTAVNRLCTVAIYAAVQC